MSLQIVAGCEYENKLLKVLLVASNINRQNSTFDIIPN